jgi:hypothetical protein
MELAAYIFLLLSTFTVAFSIPVGRFFLVISLIFTVRLFWQKHKWPPVPASAWAGFGFVVWAVIVTVFLGVNRELGVGNLPKLLWFAALPAAALLVTTPNRLAGIMWACATGTTVLAAKMLVRNPVQAVRSVQVGDAEDFISGLIHVASMSDAQRLVIGIIATIGTAYVCRQEGRSARWWRFMLVVQCVAFVMTFKRGSWFCACGVVALFVLFRANWKYLVALACVILIAFALPPVRSRLAGLKNEFQSGSGGRTTMWFKVAPALIEQHPWGIGYCSLTSEMMHEVAPEVEQGRNHLHSNIAEILVETGWLGLAVYLVWMALGFSDALRHILHARSGPISEKTYALVLLLMLLGLFANGLVEYNFAGAALVIPYGVIIGAAAAGRRRTMLQATSGGDLAE